MSTVEATADNFEDVVNDGLVLVDVWGPECQPCLALAPHVDRIADERSELTVAKLDATKARRVCMRRGVMGLPTFLLFRDGEEVARINESDLDVDRLEEWLNETLKDLPQEG